MPSLANIAVSKCSNCGRPVPLRSLCVDGRCVACHVFLCPALATEMRPATHEPQRWAGG